ncbi:MAG TPA: Wzz/FepE/Etk N-terminal domain-containing protein [Verrucomicrobiae bacterium]|jgi:polysaccharide chain length determinant protein (PEP-CTERM system associated)|nr:Wzz/FepE/Etk N-terminal domain-containing protein [Verrucomicrobiae bacterium]
MDNEIETKGVGPEWLWAVWKRRKWLAVSAFAVCFALLIGIVVFLPNIYTSTATVLVDQDQFASLLRPASGDAETRQQTVEMRLQTINQQVLSRTRLEEVIGRLNLYPELRNRVPIEDLVNRLRRDIRLELKNIEQEPGHRSTISFNVSYRARDPRTAALVANAVASFFVDQNWKTRGQQATETAAFFKAQLDDMKKQLEEKERRVASLGRLGPAGAGEYLVPYERLGDQLRLNMDRIARLSDRREAITKQLSELDPGGDPRAKVEYLAKLRRDLNEMRTRLTPEHPDVIRAQAEIAAIESGASDAKFNVQAKTEGGGDPAVQRLRNELREVDTELQNVKREGSRLQGNIGEYQRKLEAARSAESRSPDALRDYETTKELYVGLLKKYADAQQAESLEQNQRGDRFRMLDSALPPRYPSAPNRFLLKVLSFLLSLGFAAGVVLLAERLDTSFHSVESLRNFTRVPVVASIRRIETNIDRRRMRRTMGLKIVAATAVLALVVAFSYYFARNNEGIVYMLSRAPRSAESAAQ